MRTILILSLAFFCSDSFARPMEFDGRGNRHGDHHSGPGFGGRPDDFGRDEREVPVELYHDDGRCQSLVAVMNSRTDCESLRNQPAVWGVKINGVCKDIADTDAVSACRSMRGAGDPNAVSLYHDDGRCDSLVATINRHTDCESLRGLPAVWGAKVNGACKDISDTDAVSACRSLQGASDPNAVELHHDDGRCQSLVATVNYRTDCETLRGQPAIWGAKVNGVCKDISDTDAVSACRSLQGGSAPNGVELYHDDGRCQSLVATVNQWTDCQSLNGQPGIWGVKINGECRDISDTDAVSACNAFKGSAGRR